MTAEPTPDPLVSAFAGDPDMQTVVATFVHELPERRLLFCVRHTAWFFCLTICRGSLVEQVQYLKQNSFF